MKKLHILLMGCALSFPLWAEEIPIIADGAVAVQPSELMVAPTAVDPTRVVILNNQHQQTDQKSAHDQKAQVSNQPVVRVMGTPVSMTYAAELKKSREEAELHTEQKIVEKLESSRLRDEQERLNRLFSTRRSQPSTPKVIVASPANTALHGSISSPVSEELTEKVYAGFQAGQSSNFTNVKNLTSYGSFGASMGVISRAGLILESSFFYSQHQLDISDKYSNNWDNYDFEDTANVYQLSGLLALKYTPFSSRFKPYVGAFVSYSYWMYDVSDYRCNYSVYSTTNNCQKQTKADAVDVGPIVGMDMLLSHKVSIGFNILINARNLYNNRSNNYLSYDYEDYYYQDNKIHMEETHWLIASLNAKLYF